MRIRSAGGEDDDDFKIEETREAVDNEIQRRRYCEIGGGGRSGSGSRDDEYEEDCEIIGEIGVVIVWGGE